MRYLGTRLNPSESVTMSVMHAAYLSSLDDVQVCSARVRGLCSSFATLSGLLLMLGLVLLV